MRNIHPSTLVVLILAPLLFITSCANTSQNEPNPPSSTQETQDTSTEDITAETGLFRELTETPTVIDVVDTSGDILLPLGKISITKTATTSSLIPTTDELPTGVNWESDSVVMPNLVPAQGEEFIVFEVNHGYSAISDKLSLALELNGQEEVIELAPNKISTFVKSVTPEDKGNLNLIVRYDGVAQKLNLITRERLTTGVAELFYAPDGKAAIFDDGPTIKGEIPAFDGGIITASTVLQSDQTPYLEGQGWADAGASNWLLVTYNDFPYWNYEGPSFIVSTSETTLDWTLRDSEGNQYTAAPTNTRTLVFKVPAGTKDFEISFSMEGEVWESSSVMTPATITSAPLPIRFQ